MPLGTEIYVKASYFCPSGTTQPIPIETFEAGHTSGISLSANSCWVSPDLSHWALTGQSSSFAFDVCVKLYTESAPLSVLGYVPDTICHMDWLMVNQNTAMPFDSLQWLINGTYVSNQPFLHHDFFISGPGDYIISLVSWLGANSDTASAQIHFKICLGLQQPAEEIEWEVFPNPATAKIFLRSAFLPNSLLTFFDISGKAVLSLLPGKPEAEISIENWKPGIYFIELRQNSRLLQRKKIIVY